MTTKFSTKAQGEIKESQIPEYDSQQQQQQHNQQPNQRHLFVTVGATASFKTLLDAILDDAFLSVAATTHKATTTATSRFTHLTIQCGPDLAYAQKKLQDESLALHREALTIRLFDYRPDGLEAEMTACRGSAAQRKVHGVVICHAGAGTVLDAMRLDVRLIVVPNPTLLDNHQLELAKELERQGYAVRGRLDRLGAALARSDAAAAAAEGRRSWATAKKASLVDVIDEQMGYEHEVRARLD